MPRNSGSLHLGYAHCPALPAVTLPAYHHIIMMNRSGVCCRPQTARAAKQWVATANIAAPCSLSPFIFLLFLSRCSHLSILLPYLCLSVFSNISSVPSPRCPFSFHPVRFLFAWIFPMQLCPLFLLSTSSEAVAAERKLVIHIKDGARMQTEGHWRWRVPSTDNIIIVNHGLT